jgi:signal transduction histidine kinase
MDAPAPPNPTGVPHPGPDAAGAASAHLPAANAGFCQAVLDSLPAHLCVLDETGTIIAVNHAWRAFATENGLDPAAVSEGAHYLSACDRATGPWAEGAADFARGLRAVLRGAQPGFTLEYPCHSPERPRWFIGTATRLDTAGPVRALITHTNITARHLAETAVRDSHAQLRALAARLQHTREEERTAIAREVHDVFAQELTRLKFDLAWLKQRFAGTAPAPTGADLLARLDEMLGTVGAVHDGVQRLATGLRPALLDSFGLGAAVEWQVREFERQSGLACTCEVPAEEPAVSREAATAAFRILQESLSNVRRHARARHVGVRLGQEAAALVLRVTDDGRGIAPQELANPSSLGIVGMRERALLLGGRCDVRPRPEGGTCVDLQIPLGPATPPAAPAPPGGSSHP